MCIPPKPVTGCWPGLERCLEPVCVNSRMSTFSKLFWESHIERYCMVHAYNCMVVANTLSTETPVSPGLRRRWPEVKTLTHAQKWRSKFSNAGDFSRGLLNLYPEETFQFTSYLACVGRIIPLVMLPGIPMDGNAAKRLILDKLAQGCKHCFPQSTQTTMHSPFAESLTVSSG